MAAAVKVTLPDISQLKKMTLFFFERQITGCCTEVSVLFLCAFSLYLGNSGNKTKTKKKSKKTTPLQ